MIRIQSVFHWSPMDFQIQIPSKPNLIANPTCRILIFRSFF